MSNVGRIAAGRRPTNLSLNADDLAEARALGINISQACGKGLVQEIRIERARRWLEENGQALASSNAFVEVHGLPLAGKRLF